jgi:hypothetical protein
MATRFQAPYMRVKWKNYMIPMSEVREMYFGKSNNEYFIKFFYVNTNSSYNYFHFDSEEQREEFMDKLNTYMSEVTDALREDSYVPELGWVDFSPPPPSPPPPPLPKPEPKELDDLLNEIKDAISLQEPDHRPAWRKLFKPNQ